MKHNKAQPILEKWDKVETREPARNHENELLAYIKDQGSCSIARAII